VRSCVVEHPGKVAVLMTGTDLTSDGWGMVASFPRSEVIHLGPVSFAALRIWLRSATGAEPSREFAGWFYSETGGLPGNFGPALRYLERRGYVERAGGVLTPSVRYWEYDLSRELSFEAGYRVRNLPAGFATSFVGRRAATSSIIDYLRSGRSVCITGPGGSGKTRTALNAASMIEDEFRNGVCFVALSGTPMRETILSALVTALDLRTADGGDPLDQLRAFLADKEMLIILDGDDGADDPAGVIDAVRAAAPAIRFLVTSRARPAITALEEVELGGLSVPAGRLDAEGTESVELFLQVARRVRSGFQPDEDDIGEIAAICRAVDGLPLALELSASLMDGLPPAGIRRNVERDLLSLASDDGAIPERHRSMEAVFRQSWNLVPPAQQAILRKLSVFRGVITPEAATAVAGADDGLLSRLQHRWMVRRTARGRWLLPRMIRSFLEKVLLSVPAEHDAARDAHLAFFAGYLSQMEESLFTMVDWTINRLELDGAFDDIRHAWVWALARGRSGSLRQMLKPLVLYFRSRGLYDAGIEMLGRTSGELAAAEASTPGTASLVALTNVSLGLLLFLQGDLLEASRLVDDATSRPVAPDDPWTSGCILEYAGFIKFRSGEYSEAVDLLERSAGLFEAAGGRREFLQARADLGITLTAMGDVDRADSIVRETLEECRSAGFRRIEFACLQAAGGIAMARGESEAARESYMMYLAFARENGLPAEIAKTLNDLAGIAADLRDYDESEQLYRQALKIYADFGNRNGQSGVDFNLGIVAQMRGRQDEAGEHYERTLRYAEETGERFLELGSHTGLSFVHGSRREWDLALAHLVRAYDIATESGARPQALRALFGIAEVMEESGRLPEAARFLALCDGDPANDRENEDFLDKLRARLSARLTPPEMAEAREDAARLGTALLDPLRLPAR